MLCGSYPAFSVIESQVPLSLSLDILAMNYVSTTLTCFKYGDEIEIDARTCLNEPNSDYYALY
jgi:hypothetical protein